MAKRQADACRASAQAGLCSELSRNRAHEGGDARRKGQVKVLLGSKRPTKALNKPFPDGVSLIPGPTWLWCCRERRAAAGREACATREAKAAASALL